MNVKRFTARTSRDALVLVRQALGEDAVVLSTKPCADGVEVLAMAPEGMQQIERMANSSAASSGPAPQASPSRSLAARSAARVDPALSSNAVEEDMAQLSMSTLSFQDYVRERMLKRRAEAMKGEPRHQQPGADHRQDLAPRHTRPAARMVEHTPDRMPERAPVSEPASVLEQRMNEARQPVARHTPLLREPPVLHDAVRVAADSIQMPTIGESAQARQQLNQNQEDMMSELRSMKGLIEERFGALAFMEKLNRQPGQARLTQKLLDCGFSPALIRKLGDSLPNDAADESSWAAGVLERNLQTAEHEAPLEDQGGVYALVGATGVGKTTTTAKIAAAFATKYGASNLGLITLDAYRIGAHEQLRAYGRILGVPVHTAHDRASLEDLLELLAGKKMVLIDTAGMAQRDARTRELLDMLSHRSIQKLLVINAASQGETIEDVMISYKAPTCAGIVLSKMDEAVKLGPALDALIRHKLKVIGVANGQRVPEDWHRLSANALVQRALRASGSSAYKLDASDVSLIFTAAHGNPSSGAYGSRAAALHV
ncbi:flagellar biosynthesis protein FlhF [soil metagenome]